MKSPKIKFKKNALKELENAGISKSKAKSFIFAAVKQAEKIAKLGLNRVDKIHQRKRSQRKSAWKNDSHVVTYFGKGALTIGQITATRRRIKRVHRRLSQKRLTIRVFPQSKAPSINTNAQNLGFVFSPKTFKLFTRWFINNGDLQRAGIILHELNHDLFPDQRLDGETVYGEMLAKSLASRKPRRARRSAENHEWYCMRLQKPSGGID